jgi:hypothetical protein
MVPVLLPEVVVVSCRIDLAKPTFPSYKLAQTTVVFVLLMSHTIFKMVFNVVFVQ